MSPYSGVCYNLGSRAQGECSRAVRAHVRSPPERAALRAVLPPARGAGGRASLDGRRAAGGRGHDVRRDVADDGLHVPQRQRLCLRPVLLELREDDGPELLSARVLG